jgi:hypothetical protein
MSIRRVRYGVLEVAVDTILKRKQRRQQLILLEGRDVQKVGVKLTTDTELSSLEEPNAPIKDVE